MISIGCWSELTRPRARNRPGPSIPDAPADRAWEVCRRPEKTVRDEGMDDGLLVIRGGLERLDGLRCQGENRA